MIRKHFSVIFAITIFALLSIFARPIRAQAMDSTEVALILRDSKNAHEAAALALNTVACVLQAATGTVEWTATQCAEDFNKAAFGLGQEHRIIHPWMMKLLEERKNRTQS